MTFLAYFVRFDDLVANSIDRIESRSDESRIVVTAEIVNSVLKNSVAGVTDPGISGKKHRPQRGRLAVKDLGLEADRFLYTNPTGYESLIFQYDAAIPDANGVRRVPLIKVSG